MWNWLKSLFQPKAIVADLNKLIQIVENTPTSEIVTLVQEANQIIGGSQKVNVNSLAIIFDFVKALATVIESKK